MQRVVREKNIGSWLLLFLFCIGMIVATRTGAAEQPGPKQTIQTVNEALLDAMKRAEVLGYPGRYKLLEPVIKDSFALAFMGAQSTGRFWKTLSEEQRALFLKTYIDWTIATYAGRFNGFSGERFELVSETAPVQGSVTVVSKLIESNNEAISFHYILRTVEDRWRVVDIQISGVSQLARSMNGNRKKLGVEGGKERRATGSGPR